MWSADEPQRGMDSGNNVRWLPTSNAEGLHREVGLKRGGRRWIAGVVAEVLRRPSEP